MNIVAKLLIIDEKNKYLMMYRANHPYFGDDPDLPGGTLEGGESPLETMIREVKEEAGIDILENNVVQIYRGDEYSLNDNINILYVARLNSRPVVEMSWEHESYEWLERGGFIKQARAAKDTYMHMVAAVLTKLV